MGNNIVSSVIRVFDRSHLEIESISAKIDRAQIKGIREKHEIYVENIGIFQTNGVNCIENGNKVFLCSQQQSNIQSIIKEAIFSKLNKFDKTHIYLENF